MKLQLFYLFLAVACAFAQPVTTEVFTTLDREISGLMDAWVLAEEEQSNSISGLFTTGTAILRAEFAFQAAYNCNSNNLPEIVASSWNQYLKSSADCISYMKKALAPSNSSITEEVLLSSFIRWEATAERFLESVQSTR